MQRPKDLVKAITALSPQSVNNTNITGAYAPLAHYTSLLVVLMVGAIASAKKATLQLMQALDADGTSAKEISGKSVEITADTEVQAVTLTCASVVATNKVTINGVEFSAVASGADATKNEFNIGASNADAAGNLAAAIEAAFPEITASVSSNVVTLVAPIDGETLTVSDAASTITVATTKGSAFVALETEDLDTNGGYTHVAAKVTTTGNCIASVVMLLGGGRYGIKQTGPMTE